MYSTAQRQLDKHTRVTRVSHACDSHCTREWVCVHSRVVARALASALIATRVLAHARVREYNVVISLQAWPNVPIKEH